ncbi:MAG: xanthine dehydrogenase family protein subunit M [Peptococcaceae bacterium]|nr:xanthine dehydrogenase family protein subunit M [Peptococcaceae bacterium]
MLPPFDYHRPASLAEALFLLASLPGTKKILAGGTDLVPALRRGDLSPDHVVSLSQLAGMREIKEDKGFIRIGALVTFSRLAEFPLFLKGPYKLLAEAALQVGGPQVRNQGTIGGNIVNASPAGDLLPPLTALEARVRVCRQGGERVLPLAGFLTGPGRTCIHPEEILAEVDFPALPERAAGSFVKLGRRNSLAISRISLAAIVIRGEGGIVEEARLALGAVAPVPIRARKAEALLRGRKPSPALLEEAVAAISETVADSLGDRPSAPYKRAAVRGVAREALIKADPRFASGGC